MTVVELEGLRFVAKRQNRDIGDTRFGMLKHRARPWRFAPSSSTEVQNNGSALEFS